MAVAQATLCLDLLPEYPRQVARLVQRGEISQRIVREYVERVEARAAKGADVSEQEAVVARARQALSGDPAADGEQDETLVGIVQRVDDLLARIPDRFHACTSGKVSPIRKAMKELQDVRKRHPTSPELLGYLAMVLVRLDRTEDYEELLDEVRSLGQHAVGEVLWRRPDWRFPRRTPGLLKLADEGDFDERALAWRKRSAARRGRCCCNHGWFCKGTESTGQISRCSHRPWRNLRHVSSPCTTLRSTRAIHRPRS